MAVLGTTISSEDLTIAGIEEPLAGALLGLTWAQAKIKLAATVGLAAGNKALTHGGLTRFEGYERVIEVDINQLRTALETVRRAINISQSTGGIRQMPIEWGT